VAAHVVAEFRLHPGAAHDLSPEVPPAVVGLDVGHLQGFTSQDIAEFVKKLKDRVRLDLRITAGHDNGMSGGELPAIGWFKDLIERGVSVDTKIDVDAWACARDRFIRSCHRCTGGVMRIALALIVCLGAGTAHAAPVTLICNGSLTADGKEIPVNAETAVVDLEKRTFKPPLYPEFPLTKVGENDVSFGSELPNYSAWGSLDRVSGSLSMNVMRPDERKRLQAGGSVRFLAWMAAKCTPAQRMF
jgi:hypothetical protein